MIADVVGANAQAERELRGIVLDALKQHGVPTNDAQVLQLAEILHPQIVRRRQWLYRMQVAEMGRDMASRGLEVRPAPLDDYDLSATVAVVNRTTGRDPDHTVLVEGLDKKSGQARPVTVTPANRTEPEVIERVASGLGAATSRHALAAGRNVVAGTAALGMARDAETKSARRVGFARVMTGAETCSFCTMLASRGPVYSSDSVVRRRDGRRYHDNCDCVAVLVVAGQSWVGESQSKALYKKWQDVTWKKDDDGNPEIPGPNQFGQWRAYASALTDKQMQRFVPPELRN